MCVCVCVCVCVHIYNIYIYTCVQVPFETLQYIIGDVNYGGRVTDYMDQRTVAAILGIPYRSSTAACKKRFPRRLPLVVGTRQQHGSM